MPYQLPVRGQDLQLNPFYNLNEICLWEAVYIDLKLLVPQKQVPLSVRVSSLVYTCLLLLQSGSWEFIVENISV